MTDKLDVEALNAIRDLFVSQKWAPVWIARLDAIGAALAAKDAKLKELGDGFQRIYDAKDEEIKGLRAENVRLWQKYPHCTCDIAEGHLRGCPELSAVLKGRLNKAESSAAAAVETLRLEQDLNKGNRDRIAALEKERDESRALYVKDVSAAQKQIAALQAQIAQAEIELRKRGDVAYLQYSEQCRRTECLGADAKMSSGKFGRDELTAHQLAQEWLGKHKAFHEAASSLRQSVPASPRKGETVSYTTCCCARHKLDERAQCFDCWKEIEDARFVAREQEIAARAQLKLANDLIEAAEAYNVFECGHFPEDRCQCGHIQAQLAKAWNLAKIAYDKGRAEYEAKRGISKVPASHEAAECENCQGDHDAGTGCQKWRKTCRNCKVEWGYCGCGDKLGFLSEQTAASSGEAGEASNG